MKKVFLSFVFLFLYINFLNAQEIPCLTHVRTDTSSIPKYLRTGWGLPDTCLVVVVYVDFPDGRWNDNGILKQPYDTAQLKLVANKDAVGEIGLSSEINNFLLVITA